MPGLMDQFDFNVPATGETGPSYDDIYAAYTGGQEDLASFLTEWFPDITDYEEYLMGPDFGGVEIAKTQQNIRKYGIETGYEKSSKEIGQKATDISKQTRTARGQSGLAFSGEIEAEATSAYGKVGKEAGSIFTDYQADLAASQAEFDIQSYEAEQAAMQEFYGEVTQLLQYDIMEEQDPGGGGCCFIILEVEEKNGLNKDVRKYRDKMMNDQNRSGYYKLAQVAVPLMRKYRPTKWFFKYLFVNPAKSWAKWYYHKKGIGWIYEPLRRFWLGLFNYLGKGHKMKEDNG